jgi:hypothetical protein
MEHTVSDEHRERVIEQLQAGFAGDVYEVDELERRLALAHTAESRAALDALVTDLAVPAASSAAVRGSCRGGWPRAWCAATSSSICAMRGSRPA